MKYRIVIGIATLLAMISFAGCGNDNHGEVIIPANSVTRILSDPKADGDIALTQDGQRMTISQAVDTKTVLAGIDPTYGDELRGFLDFPLGGHDGVPEGARIVEATLEVFINQMTVSSNVTRLPMLIDLVSFDPPTPLIANDFYTDTQPSLLTIPFTFIPSDAGKFVPIDVTSLMQEVQRQNLPDFQVRIRIDYPASTGDGFIEIDDDPVETAPQLTVEYY